ncbi:HEAT repeat domain-containing protein [Roseivirga sp.]|uniref:HEAT repeat domain-containing protein n=1 Tax=Roseivirga sp. TaxID=1964215 RepID=UPI002B27697C|nr:HEAT repeat domain-containing protein [Roseivirga sp.]
MAIEITTALKELTGELNDKSFNASNYLGSIGSEEVVNAMIVLLDNPNPETRFMASRTLGLIENNSAALSSLFEAFKKKENSEILGDLLMALEGFDVSDSYVDIFKLYLFGSFKVSRIAEDLLDHKEFNITPRVLRKAQKHWVHFSNNVKQDEAFMLQKIEVEERLNDLKGFIDDSQS